MPGPSPGSGLTGRILGPVLKHLRGAAKNKLPRPQTRITNPRIDPAEIARDIWRSTFGQLGGERALERVPIRLPAERRLPGWNGYSSRQLHTQSLSTRIRSQAQFSRPGAIASHVGLSPSASRTFATYGPHMAKEVFGNVPLGMRALAERMKRGGKETKVGAIDRRWRQEYKKSVVTHGKAKRIEEFKRFFTLPVEEKTTVQVTESEVNSIVVSSPTHDDNTTSYLLLPLSPSLTHLMDHTTTITENDSIPVIPHTLKHVLPIHQAYTTHTHHKLLPLLIRLNAKVHLVSHDSYTLEPWLRASHNRNNIIVEVILNPTTHDPDCLRLEFNGWTEDGVRRLIRSDPASNKEDWFHIYSVPARSTPLARSESIISLSPSSVSSFSSLDMDMSSSSSIYDEFEPSHTVCPISPSESTLFMDETHAWQLPVLSESGGTGEYEYESDLDWAERETEVLEGRRVWV